ncbi:MAG TPA: type II toxin-antitoxin system prevent-host-death family antitoxin [Acidimicrobiia bacterium]|nr:type II toxin-antitoxin system prevent-host-death family antitoxin [Acidimicrobiia bacterium]
MPEVNATEASRKFADLLDAVEHRGQSFTIVRRGRAIARLEPAPAANGWYVLDLLRRRPADTGWETELEELRRLLVTEEREWPD